MKQTQKSILIWVGIIVLIIITTPWFGAFYEKIIGRELSSSFWGTGHPEYVPGFVMAWLFVPTLILTLFKKSYKQILIVLGLVLLFDISIGAWWSGFVFDLVLALVAWILGQSVLFIRKAIK